MRCRLLLKADVIAKHRFSDYQKDETVMKYFCFSVTNDFRRFILFLKMVAI